MWTLQKCSKTLVLFSKPSYICQTRYNSHCFFTSLFMLVVYFTECKCFFLLIFPNKGISHITTRTAEWVILNHLSFFQEFLCLFFIICWQNFFAFDIIKWSLFPDQFNLEKWMGHIDPYFLSSTKTVSWILRQLSIKTQRKRLSWALTFQLQKAFHKSLFFFSVCFYCVWVEWTLLVQPITSQSGMNFFLHVVCWKILSLSI